MATSRVEVGKFYKDARPDAGYYIEVLGEASSDFFGRGLLHGQLCIYSPIPYMIFVRPVDWGSWVEISKEDFAAVVQEMTERQRRSDEAEDRDSEDA